MECLTCKRVFKEIDGPRAGISVSVMGDEYIYTYIFCSACGAYTVESYYDCFLGDAKISFFSVDKATGDRAVELIRACPDPFDKNCTCPSHKAMYYGRPEDAEGNP
ncbi:MAG: hypothetical protein JW973_01795 [Bacteroidales bacterium]|nr:hypothetical protein [Bacteroidales bacterium]